MFSLQVIAVATLRNARPLLQYSYQRPPPQFRRPFSATPHPQASENPEAFITAFKNTSIFKKLADKPEALVALEEFARLLQSSGVDLSSGKRPSTLQMLKLASNSEFRTGAQRVVEELQKAGVDFKSKEIMDEMMNLSKRPPGS
ncbi:hypothetical protein BD779DRAFT_1490324 [Infundibulicybe gibba]|nr:hypothetical protein BD779DRAFT_1490324 [Infundibulicybe gibba]